MLGKREHNSGSAPFEAFPSTALAGSIVDRFRSISRRHAEHPAAADLVRSYSYAELAEAVQRAAAAIVGATGSAPGPVAILLRNDARYAVAMLGILAAGRDYVPLDADHPVGRNRRICEDAGISAVVTCSELAPMAASLAIDASPVIDLDTLERARFDAPELPTPAPEDLAYITYTSGSTGTPKGVFQNHRGLLHDILHSTEALQLTCDDRMAMFSGPHLLHGTRICFGALLNGASVHMLPAKDLTADELAAEVRRRRISVWRSVPALFAHAADALPEGETFESLRLVYLGGDRVGWSDYDRFRRSCEPSASFGTHLGSTECATLHWIVDPAYRQDGPLPLGRPLPDREVRLVDEAGAPVEDGTVGELLVTGRYLALGYWKDPALSARAFVAHPGDPDLRSFRTGDLGRRRPDGLFEFAGRKDNQVKINGFRVEPSEVEETLRGFAGVRDAAVVVRRSEAGIARSLVAYVELGEGAEGLQPRHLLALARRDLPKFMVPAAIHIRALPRLASMKLDRARLDELDARERETSARVKGSLLDRVAHIFEAEIFASRATADDNVSSLGGDSLQAVRIMAELERSFGVAIAEDGFEAVSIRELAMQIEAEQTMARV